jgi:hypothetical protein
MKIPTTKISFESNSLKFTNITVSANRNTGEPSYRTMRGVGQVIKQFMKQRFPNVPYQLSTKNYSMGDSVTVYINPFKVDEQTIDQVSNTLQAQFEYGRFNPMDDIYEYKNDNGFIKDPKSGIEFSTKYLHVQRSPKFDTKEYYEYEAQKNATKNEIFA